MRKIICPKCGQAKEVSDERFKLLIYGLLISCEECDIVVDFIEKIKEFKNGKFTIFVRKQHFKTLVHLFEENNIKWDGNRDVSLEEDKFKSERLFFSINLFDDGDLTYSTHLKPSEDIYKNIYDLFSNKFIKCCGIMDSDYWEEHCQ